MRTFLIALIAISANAVQLQSTSEASQTDAHDESQEFIDSFESLYNEWKDNSYAFSATWDPLWSEYETLKGDMKDLNGRYTENVDEMREVENSMRDVRRKTK